MKRTISATKKPKKRLPPERTSPKRDRSEIRVQSGVKKLVKAKPVKVASKNTKPDLSRKSKLLEGSSDLHQKLLRNQHSGDSSRFLISGPPNSTTKPVPELPKSYGKDRVVLLVRDPYWLHCYWELTSATLRRAEVAMDQDWHGSKLILRVYDATLEEGSHNNELAIKDIEIQPGSSNWYIEVQKPCGYRVDLGYRARSGRFYMVARSNTVNMPKPGVSDSIDENWGEVKSKMDKIFAMSGGFDKNASSDELRKLFEERLRRPMSSHFVTSLGSGAYGSKSRKFFFNLDAELIVYGSTEPTAKVTIRGEQIALRPDGTFTLRYSLPEGRQILPTVAYSADGVDERTIILAVERNTKALEPQIHEVSDL